MVRKSKKINQKTKGQAMAEFALTIPVFLLLVFGIIELSRFFLVYSSVFTAVREATRYGSSVGDEGVLNYLDCSEIAETAARTGHFGGVQKELVQISYESVAPESDESRTIVASCPNNDPGTVPEITDCEDDCEYFPSLGDRIYIEIATNYESLLGVVPNLTVDASNGRTIMMGVNQQVAVINTVNPGGSPTSTPTQTVTSTATPTSTPTATETIGQNPTATLPPTNTPSSTPVTPVVCPTQSISFNGNLVTNNNPAYARINIKNSSAFEYKLVSIENLDWKKTQGNTDRYITNITWSNNQIIWDPQVNQDPTIIKININNVSIGSNINLLPITFNFSSQPNQIDLKFTLNFVRSDDGNCPISISVGY